MSICYYDNYHYLEKEDENIFKYIENADEVSINLQNDLSISFSKLLEDKIIYLYKIVFDNKNDLYNFYEKFKDLYFEDFIFFKKKAFHKEKIVVNKINKDDNYYLKASLIYSTFSYVFKYKDRSERDLFLIEINEKLNKGSSKNKNFK